MITRRAFVSLLAPAAIVSSNAFWFLQKLFDDPAYAFENLKVVGDYIPDWDGSIFVTTIMVDMPSPRAAYLDDAVRRANEQYRRDYPRPRPGPSSSYTILMDARPDGGPMMKQYASWGEAWADPIWYPYYTEFGVKVGVVAPLGNGMSRVRLIINTEKERKC